MSQYLAAQIIAFLATAAARRDERGQTTAEYIGIMVVIVAIIGTILALKTNVRTGAQERRRQGLHDPHRQGRVTVRRNWSRTTAMRRERGEDGQAMPGLLAVTLAAFAIALGLFTLARGEEQSARSDTAADAAALAAAKQWHVEALRALQSTAMTPAIGATLTALIVYQPAIGLPTAEEFARANGATVVPGALPLDPRPVARHLDSRGDRRAARRPAQRRRRGAIHVARTAGGDRRPVQRRRQRRPRAARRQLRRPGAGRDRLHAADAGHPEPAVLECPSAAEIAASYKTERTFVD